MVNPVVHVELIGPDPDALRTFHAPLFDRTAEAGAPVAPAVSDETRYSFIAPAEGATPAAGGIGGGPGFEPHAAFSVGVEDVAAALARAESLGARSCSGCR